MPFPGMTIYPGMTLFPGGRMADWPVVTVQIEFTAGTWTHVTRHCRKVTASRGRSYEMAQADAGKLQVDLINTDGRFDPTNTSSPYYPNVLLRKRVRLQLTSAGVTKTLWQGYVTSWPQNWGEAGNFQTTQLEAFDLLGVLKQKVFGAHMVAELISQLNPLYWWPLETQDNAGRTPESINGIMYGQTLNSGGGNGVKCGGGATLAGGLEGVSQAQFTSSAAGSALPGAQMGIVNLMRVVNGQALQLPSAPFTIGMVVQSQGKPATIATIIEWIDSSGGNNQFFRVYGNVYGGISFAGKSQDGAIYSAAWPVSIADGNPHFLGIELSGTPPKIYFTVDGTYNGVIDSGNVTYGWRWNDLVDMNIGGTWPKQGYAVNSFGGLIGNVAIFPGALITNGTFTGAHSLPQVTVNGNTGTSTDQAIQNLMTMMGRGSQFTSLGTGATTLQGTIIGGSDAATVLQNLIPWEQGNLYTNGSGNLQFSPRNFRYNPTAAYALGGGPASTYHFIKVATDYDDTKMLNQAIVSRDGGATFIVNNTAAQNTYGLYSQTFDTEEVRDDQQALAQGQYIVRRFGQPATRISAVLIDVAGDPTNMVPFVMNTDIDSCVTVQHSPLAGVPQSQTCWIESVKYTIEAGSSPKFEVEHNLTPVDTSTYLTIGTARATSAIDNPSYPLSF